MVTRILRVMRSRLLKCECFVGVYETYDGRAVEVIDSRGAGCADRSHRPGAILRSPAVPSDRPGGSSRFGGS